MFHWPHQFKSNWRHYYHYFKLKHDIFVHDYILRFISFGVHFCVCVSVTSEKNAYFGSSTILSPLYTIGDFTNESCDR